MRAVFFDVSKKKNSLFVPDEETGTEFANIILKDNCDFITPEIEIQDRGFKPNNFNYFYLPDFSRYYWITGTMYYRGIWSVTGEADDLASFSSEIKSTSAYITRAAGEYDGDITDTLYPALSVCDVSRISVSSPIYGVAPSGGTYIIGVLNGEGGKRGALTYYAVGSAGFQAALASIFSDNTFPDTLDEVTRDVLKFVGNPGQYMRSCMWTPYAVGDVGGGSATIKLGYYDSGVDASTVSGIVGIHNPTDVTIPAHPQAASRGAYLNRAPYTIVELHIPPFGSIAIDTAGWQGAGSATLHLDYYIDPVSGGGTLRGGIGSNISFERSAQVGVPMQIAGVNPGLGGIYGTVANAAGDMLGGLTGIFGGGFGDTLKGLTNAVSSGVAASQATVEAKGADGSFLNALIPPCLTVKHYEITDEDNTNFGRPLYQIRNIGGMSGFIKCGEYHCNFIGALQKEREAIERYLTGGVFVE